MTIKTRKVDVKITEPDGTVVFERKGFEVPEFWSDRAATVMANKYAAKGENSAIQIIDRVVNQITEWGAEQGYFTGGEGTISAMDDYKAKLRDILINQRAAFNSPVWFNVGVEGHEPQVSACFILPLEDDMDDILEHATREGKIFKHGSGAGINVSKLRAEGEPLSNGGTTSGPLSFMKIYDAVAGCVKSGGKTRRAAKLVCMDADHPDIMDFIECKLNEEKKAKSLIDAGFDIEEAYTTIAYQNANHSIRVTDVFMSCVDNIHRGGKCGWDLTRRGDGSVVKNIFPNKILRRTAEVAWETGDPGIQFDDRMNQDNPIPSYGRINSTNPCSEFSAVDNSSCNLASLNLIKYLKEDGDMNWHKFADDIEVMITAMDIMVDPAYYPTKEIGNTTRATRPLGLGFTNLGALLMLKGLPYDSEDGRELAAIITQEMTTQAYATSIELGKKMGSFHGFNENKQVNYDLIHRLCARNWKETNPVALRNSQVTLLAPTGTISFMMDCDTTGIEPLFALKAYKQLAGGGVMVIRPKCTGEAAEKIAAGDVPGFEHRYDLYVEGVADQDKVAKEHPDIFATANEISWKAHLDMMAACQPHLNGAISKTVNMSSDCTVEDIEECYMYAWKQGLKAVAVYRDGCKDMQPMITEPPEEEVTKLTENQKKLSKHMGSSLDEMLEEEGILDEVEEQALANLGFQEEKKWTAVRRELADTVPATRHRFNIAGTKGYIHPAVYEDGTLGEVFIKMQGNGSTLQGIMDAFATAVSLALQYGVPLEKLAEKFIHNKFDPAGITTNPDIRMTSSIVDYVFRWLTQEFLDEEESDELYVTNNYASTEPYFHDSEVKTKTADGPPCSICGSMTQKSGTCFYCTNCGSSSGCS